MEPLPGGGDHGLEVVVDRLDADVDIIAVHGLGADSRYSWRYQPKKDGKVDEKAPVINWLKDEGMLPSAVTNARILAFNYHSNWAPGTDGTVIEMWQLGDELMREIVAERADKNEKYQQRPIIFIGHSFGGIVIEQGLVDACMAMSKEKSVPRCTVGVITLGTPHQGSSSAQWGTYIAHMGDILKFGGESKLISELTEGSKNLPRLVDSFVRWVNKYSVDISQFYETSRTNYGARFGFNWNEMVVPQSSACIPGFERVPLPVDHLKMAKYDGPHNPCYKKLLPVIQRMVLAAPEKGQARWNNRDFVQDNSKIAAVNLECQKALFISWPDTELKGIKRRLGERTPDTCEWLTIKGDFINWQRGDRPQVLRLIGNPGMGKSMIITYLIEELTEKLKNTPDMTLAFHFCDNRNQSSNTATAVTRQILFQLFQQRPEHFHYLQKAYDLQGPKLFTEFDTMWNILKVVVKNWGKGELYIMIDALDECDETSRGLLLDGIKQITEQDLEVRLFFTCRPEHDIEKHHKDNTRTIDCAIGLEDINRDLVRYMDDKVPAICRRHDWGDKEKELISTELVKKAGGIFLWCAFVLEDIDKVKSKTGIKQALERLPKNLQEVYQRITRDYNEDDRDAARMVLELVAGARRPLEVKELTMTYVMAKDSPATWESDVLPEQDECDDYNDVYEHCGRILRYDKPTDTVNLVHQSAKDYLLSEYLAGPDRGEHGWEKSKLTPAVMKKNTEHTNIRMNNLFLEIIFRYFGLESFQHLEYRMVFDAEWDIDWECSWWEMEPSPAFMIYAGREWENHAQNAETHGKIGETNGMGRFNEYIRGSTRNSWLRRAAITGNTPFAKWLLKEAGADRDSADFRGWTSLQLAAKYARKEVIDFFVAEGADVNAEPPHINGRTPIQAAAEENKPEIVKLLLRHGAKINNEPAKINGRTALQAAAEKANIETLECLLQQEDLDPNVLGAQVSGVTALLAGAGSGGEWQMGKNIHRTIKQRSRLPGSAEIDTQKIAEEDQQDKDQRQKEERDHEKVVKMLVNCKQGVKLIPNHFGWTALHAAVERESDEMVDDILGLPHVDSNHKGDHDGTPLHSAKAKANEELARKLEEHGSTDDCPYSKLDLDAMMKYIRAVLTRLMIKSNTERFFFIQSYIPIYHVIYSYCAEGADDQNDNPPVEQGGRRGELVYRDVDAWLKSYVMWNQKFINKTPLHNDFLTVYIREWKLFKRGAYYVGRMLRYLTRHWVKHQREELHHKDVHDIADLFFHRWRTGMTAEVRGKIKHAMLVNDKSLDKKKHNDVRVRDAINESLNVGPNGSWADFADLFESTKEYFMTFKKAKLDDDAIYDFEAKLRHMTDEFEVQGEVWGATKESLKRKEFGNWECWNSESIDYYLQELEPYFLAPYSGGKTVEVRERVDALWDMLRGDSDEAKLRAERKAANLSAADANTESNINGVHEDGDIYMANGIQQTPLKEATETTA